MRLLILILLAYILYRVVRRYLGSGPGNEQAGGGGSVDEMVQDPACHTYIPRREAIRKVVGGREFFFCSRECADKFERQMKDKR